MIDDDRPGSHERDDDFWGNTPDWTDAAERPRRQRRSESSNDITGAIKNLWGAATTGGASATRSHGVFDATAPRPVDAFDDPTTPGLDQTMFDDLDLDLDFDVEPDPGATTRVPVVDARRRRPPAAAESTGSARRLDPLLARVGAVAIVTTLLVPLAIGLRSGDSADTLTSADVSSSVEPVAESAPPPSTSESNVPAPVGSVALDPSTLPPAIPADSGDRAEAPAAPVASDTATSADTSEPVADSPSESAVAADDSIEVKASDGDTPRGTVAGVSSDPICAVDYIVQSGDYWIGIADGAGVQLAELLEANSANPSTPLYPGADICLPAGSTIPATTVAPATTAAPTTAAPTTAAPTTAAPTTAAPTTAAPTTAAPTTPAPTTPPAGPDEITQIIRDAWPDDLEDRALQIAFRESRYVPTAKNFCCYGLFQIYWEVHDSWLDGIGVTSADQLYDPSINAQAAYALYQRAGGWGPWSQTNY